MQKVAKELFAWFFWVYQLQSAQMLPNKGLFIKKWHQKHILTFFHLCKITLGNTAQCLKIIKIR
jgi:hypothetical protein